MDCVSPVVIRVDFAFFFFGNNNEGKSYLVRSIHFWMNCLRALGISCIFCIHANNRS